MPSLSLTRRDFSRLALGAGAWAAVGRAAPSDAYHFDRTISREVLENYLDRSISMEGLLNGRGDLVDNLRMLKYTGAKFIGRALCLWAGEVNLLRNLERAKAQLPKVHEADPEMIVQACVFEIVTSQVDQVPVPDWAFAALGMPVEKRNFRYADMLYPDGKRKDHWGRNSSVPDVSRPETKLYFYYLARSYIDLGVEAIHFGQVELMNGNDRDLKHYAGLLDLIRSYAAEHARRHILICDAHVPRGGFVVDGKLLMDFHSFPLRIKEVPEKPQEAILQVGFSDSLYGRSRGGITPSGWSCEHLPYLVEIDNWGAAGPPASPPPAASGSGATTRSPGSRTSPRPIATTGSATPGTGSGRPTPRATSRCPAAARCGRRWMASAGTMRTGRARRCPRGTTRRRRSARSGRATRRSSGL